MKYLDYLYFHVYNHFYQTSQTKQTFNPRLQAMYLFSLALGGWLLLLEAIYLHLVKHAWFASPSVSMIYSTSIYLLSASLFHHIFIVKDRDLKIFGKYEKSFSQHPRRKWHLLFSASILALPYLVLVFHVIFFPKHR